MISLVLPGFCQAKVGEKAKIERPRKSSKLERRQGLTFKVANHRSGVSVKNSNLVEDGGNGVKKIFSEPSFTFLDVFVAMHF